MVSKELFNMAHANTSRFCDKKSVFDGNDLNDLLGLSHHHTQLGKHADLLVCFVFTPCIPAVEIKCNFRSGPDPVQGRFGGLRLEQDRVHGRIGGMLPRHAFSRGGGGNVASQGMGPEYEHEQLGGGPQGTCRKVFSFSK